MLNKVFDFFNCPFGLAFLNKTNDGIDDNNAKDDKGIAPMAHDRRDHRRDQEQVDENIVELNK